MAAKKRKRKSSAGGKKAGKRSSKKKTGKRKASKKKAAKKKASKKKAGKKKTSKKKATKKKVAKKKVAKPRASKTPVKAKAKKRASAKAAKKATKKTPARKSRPSRAVAERPAPQTASASRSVEPKTKPERPKPTPEAQAPVAVDEENEAQSTLSEGQAAPSFELTDQAGARVSGESLTGKPYVLYFYPKDNTPGCTTEACDFRDRNSEFENLGVKVIGVSPDSERSHVGFADKFNLNFSLLADTEKELAKKFGAWVLKKNYGREYMGVQRSTFLVGPDGVIKKAWRGVKVPGHVEAVLEAASSEGEP